MRFLILLLPLLMIGCSKSDKLFGREESFKIGACYVFNKDLEKLGNQGTIHKVYAKTKTTAYTMYKYRDELFNGYTFRTDYGIELWAEDFSEVPCPSYTLEHTALQEIEAVCADAKKVAAEFDAGVCDNKDVTFNMDEE